MDTGDNKMLFLNGTFVNDAEAAVHPGNRAMMYGDGCFETLRAYQGRFLCFREHAERLQRSAAYLGIEAPEAGELKSLVDELIRKNGLAGSEAFVRIQLWRKGGRGFTPVGEDYGIMIQATPFEPSEQPGILTLCVAECRAIPETALSRKVKLSNALNYIKAAGEAAARNAGDALMLTTDGYVSETTCANIFWIQGNRIYTPSEDCDQLTGITRNQILRLCRDKNMNVHEGRYELHEMEQADAVFVCNSVKEIQEVTSLEGSEFPGSPVLNEIRKVFRKFKEKALS